MPGRLATLLALSALSLSALTIAGCKPRGPLQYKVTGTANWDGAPIDKGDIIFVPVDRHLRAEAGKIVGGKYTLRVGAGPAKVQVLASRAIAGKIDPAMNAPALEHYIPPQYNHYTTLEVDVQPNDENVANFDLQPSSAGP